MSFQDDLLTLAALDRQVVRAIIETNWETFISALKDYRSLRHSIRTRSLDKPVLEIADADSAALFRKLLVVKDCRLTKY